MNYQYVQPVKLVDPGVREHKARVRSAWIGGLIGFFIIGGPITAAAGAFVAYFVEKELQKSRRRRSLHH